MDGIAAYLKSKINYNLAEKAEPEAEAESDPVRKTPQKHCVKLIHLMQHLPDCCWSQTGD